MYSTSGIDSEMDDSEDNIYSDLDSDCDRDDVGDTVVFNCTTVRVINLYADDSNNDIEFFN